jgi:hypothetical protein
MRGEITTFWRIRQGGGCRLCSHVLPEHRVDLLDRASDTRTVAPSREEVNGAVDELLPMVEKEDGNHRDGEGQAGVFGRRRDGPGSARPIR